MKQPDVDILVNCAGVTQQSILPQTDPRTVENILDTNLRGAIWGCKFVGKHMIRTKKKGCIINVSSLLASKAVAGTSVYAASKAGLLGKGPPLMHTMHDAADRQHLLTQV